MMQDSDFEVDIPIVFVDDRSEGDRDDSSPTMPATPRALLLAGRYEDRHPRA